MHNVILYSFRRCPYAIRARMAIANSNIKVEIREIELKNKPASMIILSPKATVPVLLTANNKVIDESIDIIYWVLQQADPDGWLENLSPEQKSQAEQMIYNNDNEFKYWLDRYKYADRYPEQSQKTYRKHAETTLSELERRLTAANYLLGPELSIADIAIFPFIRQFYFVDPSWFQQSVYPQLNQWLQKLLTSTLFTVTMNKYKPWNEGDSKLIFPT